MAINTCSLCLETSQCVSQMTGKGHTMCSLMDLVFSVNVYCSKFLHILQVISKYLIKINLNTTTKLKEYRKAIYMQIFSNRALIDEHDSWDSFF